MSRESSMPVALTLAGCAALVSYLMQPEDLPPISSFLALCAFFFVVVLVSWIIDEASGLLSAWQRSRDKRRVGRRDGPDEA